MPETDNAALVQADPTLRNEAGVYTIPNLICALRLLGSPICIALAHLDRPGWFFAVMAFMVMSDWVDGKLAIWLRQRSTFGARLDSVADAMMYATVLYGMWWLKWPVVQAEAFWILAGVLSYAMTSIAGLLKFGRWPSYHTRAAKTSWLLVGIAILSVFADVRALDAYAMWPLRIAAVAVTLTNIEATLMTLVLPAWVADLPSLWHALRLRKRLHSPTS